MPAPFLTTENMSKRYVSVSEEYMLGNETGDILLFINAKVKAIPYEEDEQLFELGYFIEERYELFTKNILPSMHETIIY